MTTLLKTSALALAVAFAGSTASAINVPAGEQLIIQLQGTYSTLSGDPIAEGEELAFTDVEVSSILGTDPPIDLDGLVTGSAATFSGNFFFDDGNANTGLTVTLATNTPAVFTLANGFNLTEPGTPTGSFTVEGLGDLDGDDGSWSYSSSGAFASADFTFALAVPPTVTPPPIPLPAGAWLLLSGLGAVAFVRRKRA